MLVFNSLIQEVNKGVNWETLCNEIFKTQNLSLIISEIFLSQTWYGRFLLFYFYSFLTEKSCINMSDRNRNATNNLISRGYCLCYCKIFLLVPDSTESTKKLLPKCAVPKIKYYYRSKEKYQYRKTVLSMFDFV